MSTYTKVLEFFMQNNVRLSSDQIKDLQTYCTEGFFKNLFSKNKKSNNDSNKDSKTTDTESADSYIDDESDNTIKNYLINTLDFVKEPYTLGDGYDSTVISVLYHIGISTDKLAKHLSKNHGKMRKTDAYFGNPEEDDDWNENDINIIKNGLDVLENDDYALVFNTADNKLYEIITDKIESFDISSYSDNLCAGESWEDFVRVSKDNDDIIEQIKKAM